MAKAKTEQDDKLKKIQKALNAFGKKNESANVSIGSDDFGTVVLEDSGVWAIDRLTRGFPRGMYTHIAGPSGVGKSTFTLRLIAQLQQKGFICALANNERRFTREWAVAHGVNMDQLVGGNFTDLEQCLDFAIKMAETAAVDCLVIDTITALSSRGEMEDKKGERSTADNTMAQIPRKLSQFFRMATARINDSGMMVILVNQVRKDLGSFIVRDKSTGGNALEHNKTLDIYIRKAAKAEWPLGEDEKPCGHLIHATLQKSTHTMEARTGDMFTINFFDGVGFDNAYDICYHARQSNVIEAVGVGRYQFTDSDGEAHTVQAKKALIDRALVNYCVEHPGLLDQVRSRLEGGDLGDGNAIETEPDSTTEEVEGSA